MTEAFQAAFGADADPMLALHVWVLVHDVREGGWGAAGRTTDVAQFIDPDLDPALAEIRASVAR